MRKEVIFAVIAGISIGLIVAVGTWKVARVVKKNTPMAQIKETPAPKKNLGLTIDTLKNYDVVTDNPVIKGLTTSGALTFGSSLQAIASILNASAGWLVQSCLGVCLNAFLSSSYSR